VIDLAVLVLSCAPLVAQDTARALIQVESGGNPFAIGVVGGALVRQPANLPEAVATVAALEAAGWNYSVGLAQINKRNFQRFGLNPQTAFEPCANLRAMQGILGECFSRASRRASTQAALRDAFSCYYSGNFQTGHQHGYVSKVLAAWSTRAKPDGGASKSTVARLVLPQDRPPTAMLSVFTPISNASTNPGASQ
jgi:type IV secretion system protein VirB1